MKETCWVLTGPTASGKTALSLRLARTHDCEIVCMDSMQIYRGMDIGTAKPTADERTQAVHHMVDVADPTEDFSVARYQEMAESCIADIQARGHRALLVGGTGLYVDSVLDGYLLSGGKHPAGIAADRGRARRQRAASSAIGGG